MLNSAVREKGPTAQAGVKWAKQLTGREAAKYGNPAYLFERCSEWKEVEL